MHATPHGDGLEPTTLRAVLGAAGFVLLAPSGSPFVPVMALPRRGAWWIRANLPGPAVSTYRLDVGLALDQRSGGQFIGPVHRFHSLSAIQHGLPTVLRALDDLAAEEDELKCPLCRADWLVLIESERGPTLRCGGFKPRSLGRRGAKCHGERHDMLALTVHG